MRLRGSTRLARERERFVLSALGPKKPQQGSEKITPRRLRNEAALLREKVRQLMEKIAALEEAAQKMEAAEGLSVPNKARTISGMDAARTQMREGDGRAGRKIASDHPFPKALDAAGVRVVDWAGKHGYAPEVVRSWYAKDRAQRRRIPRQAAEAIEREFDLPADATTWPQGVK